MFDCDAVDLEFLNTAPVRLSASTHVARPPSEVFAAFAHDPANWGEFFPGFDKTGRYDTSAPHGVGSRCTKRVIGLKFEETVLAWDEGARFAFRVDRVGAPAFRAWVEEYRFDPDGGNGTLLHWAIGGRPRLAFKLAKPVLPRGIALALTRAGQNIEHGRWFSTPTNNP
jgi:polyketide cyclase/dehydrase/lipid transport protein